MKQKKILVVGGVAGGASFAARMRRLDEEAEIIMYEKGEYISFANCGLPYHIGEEIKEKDKLIIQTPEKFKKRYNIDVRVNSEVTRVDLDKKEVSVKSGEKEYKEKYDFLVLSPGGTPLRPPIPGIENEKIMTLRNIPDMDRIKEVVDKKKSGRAVVIGGGFIGLEMAENLRHRGYGVSLVELVSQVFAPADPEMANVIHQHLALNGIDLYLENGADRFEERKDGSVDTVLKNGETLNADIVILAIGVRPDTGFLKDSKLEFGQNGSIRVDECMKTSIDNVYAVGDAVEVADFITGEKILVPLAGPANRQGRIAADNIAGITSSYKKTQGTAICKIFDLTAAVSGLNEKRALKSGVPFIKSYTHSLNHAGYYPGAFMMSVKILFDPGSGRLLGTQLIGKDGVDKRIDVCAVAIRSGLTVYDLEEMELSYAPPYGSAKDPVNMAGFVAGNILQKKVTVFYSEDVEKTDVNKQLLLDVRTEDENRNAAIPDSVNIPVDELRSRAGELDKNKEIMVYCQVGLRGYIACRILSQMGFKTSNLSGGYKTYSISKTSDYDSGYLKPSGENVCSSPSAEKGGDCAEELDACGLQCPGPIMKLKEAVEKINKGNIVTIKATDQGFAYDLPSWCSRTGNTLVSLDIKDGVFKAAVRKGEPEDSCRYPDELKRDGKNKTMVIFSNDLDKMLAAFIIANGAASMNSGVTLFFTFWGLNLLRKDKKVKVKKGLVEKMFGVMMPRGSTKTRLSKMNMGGMGTAMMKMVMKKKNVMSLEELMKKAMDNGVKLVACAMSMDIMGIKKEELIDGVELGGVAYYLDKAESSNYNLFI